MDFINIDNMPTPILLGTALVIISRAVKAIPSVRDWLIPWICLVLGGVGLPLLTNKWDANNVVGGIIIGGGVVGLYSLTKQTLISRVEDAGGEAHPAIKSILGVTNPTLTATKPDATIPTP